MPHEDCIPCSPADWLRHAYSDLELAHRGRLSDKILFEELCFHAQQAVQLAEFVIGWVKKNI